MVSNATATPSVADSEQGAEVSDRPTSEPEGCRGRAVQAGRRTVVGKQLGRGDIALSGMSLGDALNMALKSATADAGLSPRQLAVRCGVTGKTVERWLADADRVPHARNREDACRALGVDEEMIWPSAMKRGK
ncbi:helix-turn-helix domain-containing protein [Kitasatospora sp. NPDC006697]|uniref:helix-turn-helix domain-containing protein n=1 Tax=Kitasatospora sp. NPDC006697 TaxID=3364020 RepID=UPI0036C7E79D